MASLRQKPRSPFFFACFTTPDGSRTQRSTKQSNRRKAQAVADKWEAAAKLGSEKRLGEAQARKILSEIYQTVNNEPLRSASTRQFLTTWADSRKADTARRTQEAYAQVARDFITSLGEKADWDISQLGKADCAKYRDEVLRRTSVATANKSLKYLRVAINAAYKDGFLQDNPAKKLDTLKRRHDEGSERRPFTIAELKKVLAHATGEWKGLILFGLYTGQRLKDIARLTWRNLDLEANKFDMTTGKTGRRISLPIAAPLLSYIQSLPGADDVAAPLFPEAHKIAINGSADSRLSQQFYGILVAAEMASERTKEGTGNGRSLKRSVNQISYHSLRHTATSLLKNAGVPEAVVMDIIGHDSKAISRQYTHIDDAAKRSALGKIPAFA